TFLWEELHDVLQFVLGWSGQAFLQLPYPRPGDWPTTPLANPPPARVPASTPRKVPIHLRLPRSVGLGGSCSGYRTGIGRSMAGPVLGPRRHRKSAAVRAGTCEFWISTSTIRP